MDNSKITSEMIAKDAYSFGMPLVFIEKQFDFNTHVTKPTGLKRLLINSDIAGNLWIPLTVWLLDSMRITYIHLLLWDLLKEPIILSIPEKGDRYWIMQLVVAWNGVPTAPGSRTHVGKACTFAKTSNFLPY